MRLPHPASILFVLSVVLLAVRLWAATHVGFGDSEALYASWALHPQPAYLDHPGLVGLVARTIGEGAAPTPERTHLITAVLATLIPWLVYGVARAGRADKSYAWGAAVVFAVVPEMAVGLFALTPDLLLAPLWLGALALAMIGLSPACATSAEREEKRKNASDAKHKGSKNAPRRARQGASADQAAATTLPSSHASSALLAAGLLAGIAASAKVSGVLLMIALFVVYLTSRKESAAARTIWPWAGLGAGLTAFAPVVFYEARLGFPMLHHRLIATQQSSSSRLTQLASNLGTLLGGQLLYVSPILVWLGFVVARDLFRRRHDDVATRVLFWSFALPFVPLLILCIWSPVAEPHWIAPPLLSLPIHAARRLTAGLTGPKDAGDPGIPQLRGVWLKVGAALAALLTALAHAWVLVPQSAALFPPTADPKVDIANELYGWPQAINAIKEQMAGAGTPFDVEGHDVVLVGPHWTVCAQLRAALPIGVRVGCATPIADDFDRWVPRDAWRRADSVLFVTDNRFGGDGAEQLPAHVRVSQSRVRVLRGGRTARVFDLYLYSRRQNALR